MAFTAVYDACVLYPVSLRDLFVRLGQTGLFRAKWTERILDEFIEALLEKRPELKDSLDRQREQMRNAIRDVDVRDYARLIPVVPVLPDPDDAHVVAAAMACGAEVIVTFNLEHFPREILKALGIEAQHPDTFVMHLIDLDREAVEAVIEAMAANKTSPPMTYDDVLGTLHGRGLPNSAAALRR
jgi:predicted nucleic acid-binding protein